MAFYPYILAVHIIFIVCWFAGLFYIVRLFIYHTEAQEKPEPDRTILSKQFEIMERRLWYVITVPSMIIVVTCGITMLCIAPVWLHQPWMHIKLTFVAGLLIYHFICQNKMKQMARGIFKWKSSHLRLWNEVSTLFLFAIVFLAVLKDSLSWLYGVFGLIGLAVVLMIGIRLYKRTRMKKGQ